MRPMPDTVALFSYGTLQQPEVQRATCGRALEGRPDTLAGYMLAPLAISSAEIVALSGKAVHTIARRTGDPAHRLPGIVFTITQGELEAIDRYEVDAYARVEVELVSGARAFAYVGPDLGSGTAGQAQR
jgi:gamma-glutamylcyclotransferase (GGCT)/AIG2-like uncharacterized protein YtfP